MGISEQTFYRWKKLYVGLGTGELRRLKQLEEENRSWSPISASTSNILQDVLSKKALRPCRRRDRVRQVQLAHRVSERRGCAALGVDRSAIRYRSTKPDQAPYGCASAIWPRPGCATAISESTSLLRREGWVVNYKRVYRLYREAG